MISRQRRWQIICFYQGRRQARFTTLSLENARFWLTWVDRNDPTSKPEIKEVWEDNYVAKAAN